MRRALLLVTLLAAACGHDQEIVSSTTEDASFCYEPPFDPSSPAAWNWCGCSEESPWRQRCKAEGGDCVGLFDVKGGVEGFSTLTCRPRCASGVCATPFAGWDAICEIDDHCTLACNDGAECPQGWTCSYSCVRDDPRGEKIAGQVCWTDDCGFGATISIQLCPGGFFVFFLLPIKAVDAPCPRRYCTQD